MPCFLQSIWSGMEWEGVIENTSSRVKAVCEPATFGHHYLVMLSHLAPSLLKPAEAVRTGQPAVFVPPCHHSVLTMRSSIETNRSANTEQGQAAWWEQGGGRRVSGREK